jgi:rubrerythrin
MFYGKLRKVAKVNKVEKFHESRTKVEKFHESRTKVEKFHESRTKVANLRKTATESYACQICGQRQQNPQQRPAQSVSQ